MENRWKDIKNSLKSGRIWRILALHMMAACVLAGCGAPGEKKYTDEQLNYLAKLEVYEAKSDALLKTIEDEEALYQYNYAQTFSGSWDEELDFEEEEAYDAYEKRWEEMKETAENAQETYYIVEYKYPAAIFSDGKPEKTLTLTLYEDTDIAKMEVAQESIKNTFVPEEFRTFYYEMAEEEREFYASLVSQEENF